MADNLYIRWSETGSDDNRTNPGAATWYRSASLKIIHPQGAANQDEGLADTEVQQKIRVLVDTKATTTNVVVQVWACAWDPPASRSCSPPAASRACGPTTSWMPTAPNSR